MKVLIVSNSITPHQIPLCEALLNRNDVKLMFFESHLIDKSRLPIGWRTLVRKDYVICYDEFCKNERHYKEEILNADAVIFGSAPIHFVQQRLEAGKLTFLYSERIYKDWKEILKWPFHYCKFRKLYGRNQNLYLLCASAYAARDYRRVGCFKGRAYKWGYFTPVPNRYESVNSNPTDEEIIRLMWCSRFIDWKHPEMPIKLAARLKNEGYRFQIDMFGEGELYEPMKKLCVRLGVSDCVIFKGAKPNNEIFEAMRNHHIFLFTSDKGEGWGAVTNEAMSNGCVVVGSRAIGSVPYLVQHRATGCVFESRSLDSLHGEVKWLFDNPKLRQIISRNGYKRMLNVWSPVNAAKNLVMLIKNLTGQAQAEIIDGPCSKHKD
jgi:glycosyltransferase involved in cell wall biosynthesis